MFVDLIVAVNVGMILATLLFMQRMANLVHVDRHTPEKLKADLGTDNIPLPNDVLVYAVEGPFFFGVAETFERALSFIHQDPKVLILRLKNVPFIDITGIHMLKEMIGQFQKRGVRVILCEIAPPIHEKLQQTEVLQLVGEANVFPSIRAALFSLSAQRSSTG